MDILALVLSAALTLAVAMVGIHATIYPDIYKRVFKKLGKLFSSNSDNNGRELQIFFQELGAKKTPNIINASRRAFVFYSVPPYWPEFNLLQLYYVSILKKLADKYRIIPVVTLFDSKRKMDKKKQNLGDEAIEAWTRNYTKFLTRAVPNCQIEKESKYFKYTLYIIIEKVLGEKNLSDNLRAFEIHILLELASCKMKGYDCIIIGGEDQECIWSPLKQGLSDVKGIKLHPVYLPLYKDPGRQLLAITDTQMIPAINDSEEQIRDKLEKWKFDIMDSENLWFCLVATILCWEGEIILESGKNKLRFDTIKSIADEKSIDENSLKEELIRSCCRIFKSAASCGS